MKKHLSKFFIKVYGCQYNEWDASRLSFFLKKIGLAETPEKEADVVFVIACSVRQTAVDRLIGKVRAWKENRKKVFIGGCMLPKDKKKIEQKGAIIFDLEDLEELNELLIREKICAKNNNKKDFINTLDLNTNCAYLPIMSGCNNFCAYCVVPYTKGREKSRPFDQVVLEFEKLVNKGQKKIMLLGQNVNSYNGAEGQKSDHNFAQLLKTLNDISGDFEISFTSNHPKDMSDEIIMAVRDLPKVKKEIHLPLQSGSNQILKLMNRPYTKEQYLKLADKIKTMIPGIRITTDVIVGFPGETEADFQETVDVYRKVNFAQSFTNKYSRREGTAAFKLGDPTSWEEKQRRWRILNDIANRH